MIVRCVLTVCNLIYVQSSERSVESGRGHHHDRRIPSLLSSQHCADATSADGAEQAAHNRDGHRLLGENVEPNTGTEEGKIRDTAGASSAGKKAFLCIFTLSSTIIICTSPLSSLYNNLFFLFCAAGRPCLVLSLAVRPHEPPRLASAHAGAAGQSRAYRAAYFEPPSQLPHLPRDIRLARAAAATQWRGHETVFVFLREEAKGQYHYPRYGHHQCQRLRSY